MSILPQRQNLRAGFSLAPVVLNWGTMPDARYRPQLFVIERLESRFLLTTTALDLNFGVNGRVSTELRTDGGVGQEFVADAVLQPDGKLLLCAANDGKPYLIR